MKTMKISSDVRICRHFRQHKSPPVNPLILIQTVDKYSTHLVQQKFDFHPTMCYNSKAKLASQRLIKLDIRAQGSDEIMGGLSKIKR